MDGFWIGLLSGAISAIIVSAIFFVINRIILRPRIKIADKICEEDNQYKFKILNCSRCSAINLKYVFTLRRKPDKDSRGKVIRCLPPYGDTYTFIPKYKKDIGYDRYEIIVVFNKENIGSLTDTMELELFVSAAHAFSGTGGNFIKTYKAKDIVQGKFALGKNTNIIEKTVSEI